MAYVVKKSSGSWELRESVSTDAGPRSRTLATFRELDAEAIEKAVSRSSRGLTERHVRDAAAAAGAPVAPPGPDRLARELLADLEGGSVPRPALRRALAERLKSTDRSPVTSGSIFATANEKGEILRDLLLLADSLPAPEIASRPRFPRLAPLLR